MDTITATRAPSVASRLRAARLVRLLTPFAAAIGGYVSAELRAPDGRPAGVTIVAGDPPVDGRLDRPPLLVVVAADDAGHAAWEAAGVLVWRVAEDEVVVALPDGERTRVPADESLAVPGIDGAGVAVRALLRCAGGGPRAR